MEAPVAQAVVVFYEVGECGRHGCRGAKQRRLRLLPCDGEEMMAKNVVVETSYWPVPLLWRLGFYRKRTRTYPVIENGVDYVATRDDLEAYEGPTLHLGTKENKKT